MTTKHTSEPWCFYLSPVGLPGSDWSLYQDMDTGTGEPDAADHIGEVFGQSVAENNANALRIVSCVNSSVGLSNVELEGIAQQGGLKVVLDRLTGELAALRSQRDELREALRECVTEDGALAWRNAKFAGMRLESISNTARAALARCGKEGK